MEKIELTLNVNYLPEWKTWSGIRELVQNAKDAETEFKAAWGTAHANDDELTIWNDKVVLSRDVLLFGTTSKVGGKAALIGQFGEGLKLGTLALVREDKKVSIHTGKEIWTPKIGKSDKFGCDVLYFHIEPAEEEFKGVKIKVSPVSKTAWGAYRNKMLFLLPDYEKYSYQEDEILISPKMFGKIFSKGIFVCEDKRFKYGYNLNGVSIDRDRKMPDATGALWAIWSLWQDVVVDNALLCPLLYDLLLEATEDTSIVTWINLFNDDARKLLANEFKRRHGEESVPVINDLTRLELEHFGIRGIIVSDRLCKVLEGAFGSLSEIKERIRGEIKWEIDEKDLSEVEKINILYVTGLLKKAGEDPIFTIVEFKTNDIIGLYDSGHIKIARRILVDRSQLLATLIHEVAHKHGADGTSSHVQYIEAMWSDITKDFMFRLNEA